MLGVKGQNLEELGGGYPVFRENEEEGKEEFSVEVIPEWR